jgi:hypothetical protein
MILLISTPLGAPFISAILTSALFEVLNVGASALPSIALVDASSITSLSNLSTKVGLVSLNFSLSLTKLPINLLIVTSFSPGVFFNLPSILLS